MIKAIERLVGGSYGPSPGVIYPTLNDLADTGLATSMEQDGGRRQYDITPIGRIELDGQRAEL